MRCKQGCSRSACTTVQSDVGLLCSSTYSIHWFCKQTMKAQISLPKWAGWSRPAFSANCIRALFVNCVSKNKEKLENCQVSKIPVINSTRQEYHKHEVRRMCFWYVRYQISRCTHTSNSINISSIVYILWIIFSVIHNEDQKLPYWS